MGNHANRSNARRAEHARQTTEHINKALDLYAEWLNKTNAALDPEFDFNYSPKDFLAYPINIYVDQTGDGAYDRRRILAFTLTDGDEGGMHALILIIDPDADEIRAIVQEFDTYHTLIFDASANPSLIIPTTTPTTEG